MAITKVIKSDSKQFKPILKDTIVLDTVPTVGSFNGITSDGVAQAISSSGNVPTPAAGDTGKVLTANNGSYEWADPTGTEYTAGTGISISDENAISVSEAVSSGASAGSTAVQPGDLAAVATSGSYDDLTDKPTIPSAQVNSDWNAESGVAAILNKPSLATVATSGSYTDLSNKPNIPEAQVNSDWSASTGVAAILNKPDLSVYAQSANLATVATSGDYADLTNKPTIPAAQVQSNWAENDSSSKAYIQNKPDMTAYAQTAKLATVAVTGDYADLLNKPALATVATSGSYADLSNKPSIPAAQVNADWDAVSGVEQILNKPNLATVATTGSYNDLQDKPTIPSAVTVDQHYDSLSANPQSGVAVAEAIAGTGQVPTVTSSDDNKVLMASYSGGVGSFAWEPSAAATQVNSDWNASSGVAAILNKPDLSVYAQTNNLATVAISGSYNDLSNRPSIPAAQVNSDWEAASGVAQILNKPVLATVATSGDYADLTNKPAIPAAQVQANWNESDNTSKAYIQNKPDLTAYAVAANLSTVATTGDYDDLTNKPSIPAAQVNSDWNESSSSSKAFILNKPNLSIYAQSANLATVATSGSYNDLSDKPTIPAAVTVDQTYSASSTNAQSGVAVAGALATVNQVPSSTSSDEDKVLTVDSNGDPVWAAAQGGSSYTAGDGIAITNNEIKVRVKDDNPLKVTTQQQSVTYASVVTPEGTPSSEGWKALELDPYYITREYDEDHDVTLIGLSYLCRDYTLNTLAMSSLSEDSTKHFDAKLHLLWISGKESYTEIVATSDTLSDAFTAGWDTDQTTYTYSLGSLVDTTEDGRVFHVNFYVPGDHRGDWNALAFSSSGSDYSGIDHTVQSSFLSESHVLALPYDDDVYIVGETIPGGDLYVDVATEWDPYSDKLPTCAVVDSAISERLPSPEGVENGAVLTAGYDSAQWELPTKVEYANQELTVQPPYGESLTIDASDATPAQGTESYEEAFQTLNSSTLIAATTGWLGGKDLVSGTLYIPYDIEATGITLNDLEFNYYQGDHGSYNEESVSPMVVTGAISASPSKILAGNYTIPIVPNPDPTYDSFCIKFTYSGSPDQADLDAFVSELENGIPDWRVTGDIRVVTGYSIKPAVLPSLTGNAGKVLAVNSGATGTEWVEQPSLSVTTDGVMAGTGSAQDPVVLNYGSGLSTVNSQTTTLANVTGISTNGTMTTSFELTAQDCAAINASIASGLAEVSMVPSASYSLIMDSAASADNNVRFELIDRNSNTQYYGPVVATIPQGQTSVTVDSSNFSRLPLDQFHVGSVSGPTLDGSTYALLASNDYVVVLSGDEYVDTYDSRTLTIDFVEAGVPQLVVSNPVPSIAGNAGKILAVNSSATGTEWVASNSYTFSTGLTTSGNTVSVTNPVPAVSGHAGQILAVNSGATGTEWVNAPSASVSATGVIAGNGTSPSPLQLNYNSTLTSTNGVIPEVHTQSLSWDNSNHLSGIAVTYADYNKLKNLGYSNVKLQLVFPSTYVCALTRQGSNEDCYLHIADTTGNYKGVSGGLGNVGTGYTVVPDLSNITLSSLGFTTENALHDGTYYIWFSTNYQAVSYQDEVGTMYNVFADYNPSLGDGTDTTTVVNIGATGAQLGVSVASLTTAGITDIQQVAALPASPVATVLYLIPEA